MSNKPSRGSVHIDAGLTNISIAYIQSADNFVADKVFPIVDVQHASDEYFIFNMGDFHRDEAKDRAPATESAGGDFTLTTDTYSIKVKSFHKDVPWQTEANADFDLKQAATEYVTQKMLIAKEKQFIASFMATSIWGYQRAGDASGSVGSGEVLHWSDANSAPITDVENAAYAIQMKTGFRPNKLVLGAKAYSALKNHPDFLERVNGGATTDKPAKVVRALMAQMFEVEEILVMGAIENTAKEGQTASTDFMSARNALLVYAAPRPNLMALSAGYTFRWNKYLGASKNGIWMKDFEMEQLEADRIEGSIAEAQKLVAADAGAYFSNIVAA